MTTPTNLNPARIQVPVRTAMVVGLLSAWVVSLAIPVTGFAGEPARDVSVMSFNIRYGTASDGQNHWERRKAFVVDTIRAFDPDLLGTQETLGFQRDYLAEHLPEYDCLGVGRNDGRESGEMMAVYFKPARFEQVAGGHFWLSETPDQPGSKSWDSSLPRMVTWVKLRDRRSAAGRPILFLNTHFDHRGAEARLESARLLCRRIETLGRGHSLIVTGDFNAGERSEPYRALFGPAEGRASPLVDAFRVAHPQASSDEGTFSGFKAGASGGSRIDWIGVSRDWQIVRAEIDRTSRNGRTPSDHFPVTAVLRYRSEQNPRDLIPPQTKRRPTLRPVP
jgi:endonuclease/exonuclease/phosphatase family metal-dependent hydrolase